MRQRYQLTLACVNETRSVIARLAHTRIMTGYSRTRALSIGVTARRSTIEFNE